ncbi:MAG: nitroreductase [Bacteroidetes bacterium]|nr:nitroreductase [Bacteroidota bacterium]
MDNIISEQVINTIIKSRRSITPPLYEKGKVVPDEIIVQILQNANYAPNHKHTEPWRFTIFAGDGLAHFAKLQSTVYKDYAGEKFKELSYRKLQDFPLMASHIIAIGMKRDVELRLPEIEEIEATACAVQNMFLTTTAYGLASYWTTGGITYIPEAKAHFGLEAGDKLLGFFYIGYPAKPFGEGYKRGNIEEKIRWVKSDI